MLTEHLREAVSVFIDLGHISAHKFKSCLGKFDKTHRKIPRSVSLFDYMLLS